MIRYIILLVVAAPIMILLDRRFNFPRVVFWSIWTLIVILCVVAT